MYSDQLWAWLVTMAAAYLLGSFSTSITVGKLFYRQDIRKVGSGNAGATNTLRNYGVKKALLVALGDTLKTVFAMLLARLILGKTAMIYAGLVAVIGHIFPVYYRFKGGKGVMSAGAAILMYDWRIFFLVIGLFILIVVTTRYVSLGSLICAVVFPISAALLHWPDKGNVLACVAIALIVILKHHENIRRLIHGTESKIGSKKAQANQ